MIEIKDKKRCNGCQACFNACPQGCIIMKTDVEGFLYPEANSENCLGCSLCEEVCPIIANAYKKESVPLNRARAYACLNKNENVRMASSSGGIFSVVAELVIESGGAVFGACFDHDFDVKHCFIESTTELAKLRGSKYVQSSIGNSYKQVKELLSQNRKVLFVGAPCQVAGLNAFLDKPDDNLICIDFICFGVPSPGVWQKYLSYRESVAGSKPQQITFRAKDNGWVNYCLSILFENGSQYQQTHQQDLFMKLFLKGLSLRPSCYDCSFKTLNRQSDLTLADFWGIQDILPEFDDNKGASLIMVHTGKGQKMLKKAYNQIILREVSIDQALLYNQAAVKSASYNLKRNHFFKELDKRSFDSLVKKYCSDGAFNKASRKAKYLIHKLLTMIR